MGAKSTHGIECTELGVKSIKLNVKSIELGVKLMELGFNSYRVRSQLDRVSRHVIKLENQVDRLWSKAVDTVESKA